MTKLYKTLGTLSDSQTIILDTPTTLPTGPVRITLELVSPPSFWGETSIDDLAKQQAIEPVRSLDELWGDFWPEDESVDDFIDTVRSWRRESIDD